ncbi:MAG: monovalent cation/H(+) antiporter subunit G [Egibacteraceae bacterium]
MLDAIAVALVMVGLAVTTISLYGVLRLPDLYGQLHAAGMATGFGVITILVASIATRNAAVITHAGLVVIFLLLTTPVASHAIARAVYREEASEAARTRPTAAPEGREERPR